jgi:hypothetical protein
MFKVVKTNRLANVKNDKREPLILCMDELIKCANRLDRLATKKDNDEGAQRLNSLARECRLLHLWIREEYKLRKL